MNENDKAYYLDMSGASHDREMYWDNYGEVEDCICGRWYQRGVAVALYQAHEGHSRELFSACSEECCLEIASSRGIRADEIQGV